MKVGSLTEMEGNFIMTYVVRQLIEGPRETGQPVNGVKGDY